MTYASVCYDFIYRHLHFIWPCENQDNPVHIHRVPLAHAASPLVGDCSNLLRRCKGTNKRAKSKRKARFSLTFPSDNAFIKTENFLHLLRIFLHRFRVASGREMPYTYHTHAIHMPYTYHTHTIPLSMATIWHHREKTEASPCITTTSYMRNGSEVDGSVSSLPFS